MAPQGQPQQPDLSVDIASLWGVFLYGFCTSLLMPVFMANVVTDKQVSAGGSARSWRRRGAS